MSASLSIVREYSGIAKLLISSKKNIYPKHDKRIFFFSKPLLTCILFFAASILSTQTIIAQDSDNDGMIDALGNASADGEFDTYPNRLDSYRVQYWH